jgi:hypothetical protein
LKTKKSLFIDFISAHEIRVVAKVPQEPTKFPQRFGSAVETPVEGTVLMFSWFENGEPQNIEGTFGMPAIEDAIDTDEENTFQDALGVVSFMQPWDVTFHGATSCDLE